MDNIETENYEVLDNSYSITIESKELDGIVSTTISNFEQLGTVLEDTFGEELNNGVSYTLSMRKQ